MIVAWRDIASPHAGGSELLVDQLAAGMVRQGDRVTLLCGRPRLPDRARRRPVQPVSGGTVRYWRQLRDCDVVVEVCNGVPFASAWAALALDPAISPAVIDEAVNEAR